MKLQYKNILMLFQTIIIITLLYQTIQSKKEITSIPAQPESPALEDNQDNNDLTKFPILDLPAAYFDNSEKLNIGANAAQYSSILNEQYYRSYPYTDVQINPDMYSNDIGELPPVKTDDQIFAEDSMYDFGGSSKRKSIDKFGDMARRFAGEPGSGVYVYTIEEFDVNADGGNEKIISLLELGANIIGGWNVIVNDQDEIIFSSHKHSFSTINAAESGDGFYLEWDDNFKGRDGNIKTRFIFEEGKFVPVYEQQIRFIRVKN